MDLLTLPYSLSIQILQKVKFIDGIQFIKASKVSKSWIENFNPRIGKIEAKWRPAFQNQLDVIGKCEEIILRWESSNHSTEQLKEAMNYFKKEAEELPGLIEQVNIFYREDLKKDELYMDPKTSETYSKLLNRKTHLEPGYENLLRLS